MSRNSQRTHREAQKLVKIELEKCMKDPVYFMKTYCKIQHPTKGTVPFELYPFQEDALKSFREHKYNIVLKCRQMGISTLTAGYSLWLMTFFKDKNCLCAAIDKETAKNLVTKVSVMYENLPRWLKQPLSENNKLSMRFENGSQIKAVASKPDSARSEALSFLIIDEAHFIRCANELWVGAQSTLAEGGQCMILSTPNGVGGFFYDMWVGAEEGRNGFNPIKLHWSLHPNKDQKWRDEQDTALGHKKAAQECDCLWGESKIRVLNVKTNQEEWITMENLYKKLS